MNNHVKVPTKLSLAVIAACLVSFCGLITETAVNIGSLLCQASIIHRLPDSAYIKWHHQ